MAMGSTQPLTEMGTRNFPRGVKGRLPRKCWSLDLSQPYGPSGPLTGIDLPLPFISFVSVIFIIVVGFEVFFIFLRHCYKL
jgi:hypothetical protein